jgi:hypothetical protein
MEKPTLESRWNEKTAAMKKAYPKLTDEDVKYVHENHQTLLTNLSNKTGLAEEDLIIWLDSL